MAKKKCHRSMLGASGDMALVRCVNSVLGGKNMFSLISYNLFLPILFLGTVMHTKSYLYANIASY